MRTMTLFEPSGPATRRRTVSLMVMLAVVVAVLVGPTPAAVAAGPQGATDGGATAAVDDPATLADLRQLVEDFEATGQVTFRGARRLGAVLRMAELYDELGMDFRTILTLELFKDAAGDPLSVPDGTARDALIALADQLIDQLGGSPS